MFKTSSVAKWVPEAWGGGFGPALFLSQLRRRLCHRRETVGHVTTSESGVLFNLLDADTPCDITTWTPAAGNRAASPPRPLCIQQPFQRKVFFSFMSSSSLSLLC